MMMMMRSMMVVSDTATDTSEQLMMPVCVGGVD